MLPQKMGPCEAYMPRWFFNQDSGQCEQFGWGGCDPNGNNFDDMDKCEKRCMQPQLPSPPQKPKPKGTYKHIYNYL